MASHIVVGFAKRGVRKEVAQWVVECVDSQLQRCGVVIEHVLVLVQTVRYSNDMLGLLVARGIAARNEEQAEKQVCEMTNRLHNKRY